MTDFRDWFRSHTGHRITVEDMAGILDISRPTATRRVKEGFNAQEIIDLCAGLNVNPVAALVDLGHLDHAQVLDFIDSEGSNIDAMDEAEISLYLARRLNPPAMSSALDELAARRSPATTPDVAGLDYVADSSPDEPEEGDDDYHDGP